MYAQTWITMYVYLYVYVFGWIGINQHIYTK